CDTSIMPITSVTVIPLPATARLGSPHTLIFGGFSASANADRVKNCGVEFVITADGGYRKGKASGLKSVVDEAMVDCPEVRNVLVVQRTGQDVDLKEGRDLLCQEVVDRQFEIITPVAFDSV